MEINYTKHATQRCKQRNLPPEVLDLVVSLGDEFRAGGDTCIRAITSKLMKSELIDELKAKDIPVKQKWCDAYLVMTSSGKVITVGYRNKRLKNRRN